MNDGAVAAPTVNGMPPQEAVPGSAVQISAASTVQSTSEGSADPVTTMSVGAMVVSAPAGFAPSVSPIPDL